MPEATTNAVPFTELSVTYSILNSSEPETSLFLWLTMEPAITEKRQQTHVVFQNLLVPMLAGYIPEATPLHEAYPTEHFILEVVIGGLFCLLGLVCNLFAVVGLQKSKQKNITSFILTALAVTDWIILLYLCLSKVVPFLCVHLGVQSCYGPLFEATVYMWPVGCMAQTAMTWLVVLVTLDRYIAICHPLRAPAVETLSNAKRAVAVIWIVAILVNLPRFFYYTDLDRGAKITSESIFLAPDENTDLSGLEDLTTFDMGLRDLTTFDTVTHQTSLPARDTKQPEGSASPYPLDIFTADSPKSEPVSGEPISGGKNSTFLSTDPEQTSESPSRPEDMNVTLTLEMVYDYKSEMIADPDMSANDLEFEDDSPFEVSKQERWRKAQEELRKFIPSPRTGLGDNFWYKTIYYTGFFWLSIYLFPMVMLLVLNLKLTKAIQQAKVIHAHIACTSATSEEDKDNRSVTANIIAVVVVFLVCQTPDFVQVVISYPDLNVDVYVVSLMSAISTTFMAINSSINFVIYCLFYRKFRVTMRKMFCPRMGVDEQSSVTLSSRSFRLTARKSQHNNNPIAGTSGQTI